MKLETKYYMSGTIYRLVGKRAKIEFGIYNDGTRGNAMEGEADFICLDHWGEQVIEDFERSKSLYELFRK